MRSSSRTVFGLLFSLLTLAALTGCDNDSDSGPGAGTDTGTGTRTDGGVGLPDGSVVGGGSTDAGGLPDAYFVEEAPPSMCLADGTRIDPPATAPAMCPPDRRRQGCPCTELGETGACWPGPRRNRGRGICRDGQATCVETDEFGGYWGPCLGAILPTPGATSGAAACECFSVGTWAIDNLNPCFIRNGMGQTTGAVSTFINSSGIAQCPTRIQNPPQPEPGASWSTDRLQVDCAGQFQLCYTIKAGDSDNPSDLDCTLAESCVEAWYPEANVLTELPPLPSWTSNDLTCIQQFQSIGGYGEMSVRGLSIECDEVEAEDGGRLVFNRVTYCPQTCNDNPNAPGCENCRMGGSGSF